MVKQSRSGPSEALLSPNKDLMGRVAQAAAGRSGYRPISDYMEQDPKAVLGTGTCRRRPRRPGVGRCP